MKEQSFEDYLAKLHGFPVKRDGKATSANLTMVGDGANKRLVAKKDCEIYIPKRWAYHDLADTGELKKITCIYAIVSGNTYGVVNQVNRIRIDPDSMTIVTINDDEYFRFVFKAGSVVFPELDLVKEDVLAYPIYDELIAKGNVPAYLSYDDYCKILRTAKTNAGINLSPSNIILEMTAAVVTRNPDDRRKLYRYTLGKGKQPIFIGLRNITLTASNFITRTAGSYFEAGIESELANPSTSKESVETKLRI